jgi:ECF sigma factor
MSPDLLTPLSAEKRAPQPNQEPDEFKDLLGRTCEGDEGAAALLYNRYQKAVLKVVRCVLSPVVRKVADSTDFTQEAWLSVLWNIENGKEFASPAHFMAFLKEVARRKVFQFHRYHVKTRKRSLAREEGVHRHVQEVGGRPGPDNDPRKGRLPRTSGRVCWPPCRSAPAPSSWDCGAVKMWRHWPGDRVFQR